MLATTPVVVEETADLSTISLQGSIVSLDLETTGLDWYHDDVLLVSLATDLHTIVVINATTVDRQVLREWLLSQLQDRLMVGQNLSFDLKFLARHFNYDLRSCYYYDTKLAEIVLFAGLNYSNSLKDIALRCLKIDLDKTVREDFVKHKTDLLMTERHYQYAALDALVTLAVRELQLIDLRERDLETVAELEMRLLPVVVGMELRGVPFDYDKFRQFAAQPFNNFGSR